MNARLKTGLMLGGTLVIGMVLGGMIAVHHFRGRIHRIKELQRRGGFTEHVIKSAEPTAAQEAAIRPILERFGDHMEALHKTHREQLKANLDRLRDSLDVHLDEGQMDAVKEAFHRMHGGRGMRLHRFGPGHGGHGGHK